MRVMTVKDKGRMAALLKAAAVQLGADAPDGAVDGIFSVGTADGGSVEVVVTYDAMNDCFNLCAPVAEEIAEGDAEAFRSLLVRNYRFEETDGAAFAVDPEGAVVVQRDLAAAELQPAAFAEAVRSIAAQAASVSKMDN